MPSPSPSALIAFASAAGFGSMCGKPCSRSAIVSMSKNTAPGMCAYRNSAAPMRPVFGKCQDASITPRSGLPSSAASSAVVQKFRVDIQAPFRSGAGERDTHATVDLALFLDSRHRCVADLAGARDMGAPAWLEVEALDRDQADMAGSHRRLDRHGLDQTRIGLELGVGDPAMSHRRIERDQFVEPALDLGLVD